MSSRYVFWQNMPTHLQSPWISELASRRSSGVWVAFESGIPEWRARMGWGLPDYGAASVHIGLTETTIKRVISEAGTEAVHVFSGLRAYPGVSHALRYCVREGRPLGLMAESSPRGGLMGAARIVMGRASRIRYSRHVQFVLAIGEDGPNWFRTLGFRQDRIFEFAYFPPPPPAKDPVSNGVSTFQMLYIGQLIPRKGLDRLLEALGGINGPLWHLKIIGVGTEESALKSFAAKLGVHDRVSFLGAMSNSDAMAELSRADMLLLPSRFDGYGAVINEALLSGVPVICSDTCGARQVLNMAPEFGEVFDSVPTLSSAIKRWLARGPRTGQRTAIVRALAQCIAPRTGADYFADLMAHVYSRGPRPTPPWRVPLPISQS